MKINRQDTNGVKPLLAVGELGYDNYPTGGDAGRVYVGTGSSNIAQAKKSEVVAVDGKVDTHIARIDNPHGVTKTQVGLSNVDNTADSLKVVASAGKWTTSRLINGTAVDGTVNITTSQWGTSRNITIGNTLKTVNGSGDVSWSLAEIGAIGTASPAFTGVPTAPTAASTVSSAQIATTAFAVPRTSTTGSAVIPSGTTAQRDASPVDGLIRYNSITMGFEGYFNGQWQSVVSSQIRNITVNVGAGKTYTTINQALEYLSGFYPIYIKSGITATINLKAGFVMAEQVLVSGIDLGWITIVGEDAETIITHTALTTSFNGTYPAFGVDKGGTSPIIGQLFRFNVEKVGGNKHGLMTFGAGSSASISYGKGFIGAGTYGIFADSASTINANSANCSNAGSNGILAVRASIINAEGANCSNAGINGVYAINTSIINANSANCSNAGSNGIVAEIGSTINANSANCSNAGINGVVAARGSTVNAYQAIIQNQTTGTARIAVTFGSHIEVAGIDTTGGTTPVFNQAVNTLTSNGIIYQ